MNNQCKKCGKEKPLAVAGPQPFVDDKGCSECGRPLNTEDKKKFPKAGTELNLD